MKRTKLALCGLTWLAVVLFLIQPVFAVTHYVPDDYATIQAAVNAAGVGEKIVVRSGTYTGEGNKNIVVDAKFITIESEAGPEYTIIDCEGDGRGFYFKNVDQYTSLIGFKIINGVVPDTGDGGAIWLENGSPCIRNCIISGNTANYGGGIHMYQSTPSITNCIISGNTANYGGGICIYYSMPSITNCIVSGNTANSTGGAVYSYGKYYSAPPVTVTNCTISGNVAQESGGWYAFSASDTLTNNTIVYFNFPGPQLAGGPFVVTYSNIAGGFEGEGNIDAPPQFVGGGDFHLSQGSPCIDAGTAQGAPDYDLDGNPRPYGAGYDMGAYEYQGSEPNPPDIKANGQDGPITVSRTTPVAIDISIDPGAHAGQPVELWIVVQWPFGMFWNYYSYQYPAGWRPGINRCIEMTLPALSSTNLLTATLPPSNYEFFFLIDDQVDGIPEGTWMDSVKVHVTP